MSWMKNGLLNADKKKGTLKPAYLRIQKQQRRKGRS